MRPARARHPRRDDCRRHHHPRGQQSAIRGRLRLRHRHRISAVLASYFRDHTPSRANTAHCIILVYVKVPLLELGQDLHQAGVLSGLAWMRGSKGGIYQDSQSNIYLASEPPSTMHNSLYLSLYELRTRFVPLCIFLVAPRKMPWYTTPYADLRLESFAACFPDRPTPCSMFSHPRRQNPK
jgi:hypothetical protein